MHAEDLGEPGRDGQTVFRQRNRAQLGIDDSAEVRVLRPAADQDPPLDASMADANRNLPVRLDGKNAGQMCDLLDDVLWTSFDEAYRRIMPVRDEVGDVDQVLDGVLQEQRYNDDRRRKR